MVYGHASHLIKSGKGALSAGQIRSRNRPVPWLTARSFGCQGQLHKPSARTAHRYARSATSAASHIISLPTIPSCCSTTQTRRVTKSNQSTSPPVRFTSCCNTQTILSSSHTSHRMKNGSRSAWSPAPAVAAFTWRLSPATTKSPKASGFSSWTVTVWSASRSGFPRRRSVLSL